MAWKYRRRKEMHVSCFLLLPHASNAECMCAVVTHQCLVNITTQENICPKWAAQFHNTIRAIFISTAKEKKTGVGYGNGKGSCEGYEQK